MIKVWRQTVLVGIALWLAASLQGRENPGVYHYSWEILLSNRASLQAGEPRLVAALENLIQDAETALELPLMSVQDKIYIAKSGDKHDYLSIGRYSWPNPNTEDGLPWVTRDGMVGPGVSDDTDFLRFGRLNRAVSTLGLAYFFTGEVRYADKAAALIRHWYIQEETRMNPNFTYAQVVPGTRDENLMGYGVIEANSLSALLDGIGLIQDSGVWSEEDQQAILEWMTELYRWLQESPHARAAYNLKHNIGTWADGLTAHIALFCSDREEAERVLSEVLQRRINVQIQPDGSQPHEERRRTSFAYYLYNVNALLKCAILGEHVGVNLFDYQSADGRSIRKALAYVAPYLNPEREWVKQDITEIKRTPLLTILSSWLNYRDDPEFLELFETYGKDRQLDHRWRLLSRPHIEEE